MRSSKTEAIIIKKRNFGEKDRILTLFSRDRGKLDAIAKGSRRPGSRFSYFSDIGSIGTFYLYESKSMPIVTDYKSIFSPEGAMGEFDRTEKLSFAFKLVDKLFESGEPHQRTYDILQKATKKISKSDEQLVFLAFMFGIICDLGLGPELVNCVECKKKIKDDEQIFFSFDSGVCHKGCVKGEAQKTNSDVIKLLRLILNMTYSEISNRYVKPEVFKSAYEVTLRYIKWHFGKILPEKTL